MKTVITTALAVFLGSFAVTAGTIGFPAAVLTPTVSVEVSTDLPPVVVEVAKETPPKEVVVVAKTPVDKDVAITMECRTVGIIIPLYNNHLVAKNQPGANIIVTLQRLDGPLETDLSRCNPRNVVHGLAARGYPNYADIKVGYPIYIGAFLKVPSGEDFRVTFLDTEAGIKETLVAMMTSDSSEVTLTAPPAK